MNILICDDERFAAEKIAELVSRSAVQHHLAVSVVKYTDVEKCLASPLNQCDIAFFDIDMKPYNGIDLARKLHNENPNAIIIFVTNYIEYAPAGYEVNAFRYLLKPEISRSFPALIAAVSVCRSPARETVFYRRIAATNNICGIL